MNKLEGLWDVACLHVSWCWHASSGRLLSSPLAILPVPRQPSPLAGPGMCVGGEGYRRRDDDSQPLALCVPSLYSTLRIPASPGAPRAPLPRRRHQGCRHLWEPLLGSHCLRGSPGPRPAGFYMMPALGP